jgi:hypothetical protein
MSKFIPNKDKKNYGGQVKPKLKVKVIINEEEKILNEYDAFTMISDVNNRLSSLEKLVQDLGQAVSGIMDAMSAATAGVSEPKVQSTGPMKPTPIKLPKLNKVESKGLSGDHIYPNSSDSVTLQS